MYGRILVIAAFALVSAAATSVSQCPGKSFPDLEERVQLTPCNKVPCKLRKGTNQQISMRFTPDKDLDKVTNSVTAELLVTLPFVGVDGTPICDKIELESGEKASCPLKAGTTYVYKDSFPILSFYPEVSLKVHWALKHGNDDIICFEVPARITKQK